MNEKPHIARRFGASAGRYDAAAAVQRWAAEELAARLMRIDLPPTPRVLEIGCGTGLLTRRLLPSLQGGTWLATDIAPEMVAETQRRLNDPRLKLRVMDGERPDADLAGAFDLVVSGMTVQWFEHLAGGLAALRQCLASGGWLAVSLPTAGSFAEWRQALAERGLPCGLRDLPSEDEVRAALAGHGDVVCERRRFPTTYGDAAAFLAAMKAIGAGTPRHGHRPLPPGSLRAAIRSLGQPVTVTHEIVFAIVRKKGKT